MSFGQVCHALGISAVELVTLLRAGRLRISEESVEEYIAQQLQPRAS